MKKVKILKNDGNTVFIDSCLDEIDDKDKPKVHCNVVWVYYGKTTKEEMLEHIEHRDYMVCQYHTEGYNTAFIYPMSCVINFSQHGTEMIEFTNDWVDDEVKHITYNIGTDTWSAR